MDNKSVKRKSFWQKPEGVTGLIFGVGILAGLGYLAYLLIPILFQLATSTLYLTLMLVALAALLYVIFDPKMRNLIWYMYKSVMRWITAWFVKIDPIGILKSYVDELKGNLVKMNKQLNQLRGQMHKLQELIINNKRQIESNLKIASEAKQHNKRDVMILKSRKAGRLRDSNVRLEDLYKKMETLYRVLKKMYENSNIMLEDLKDQVAIKEQEQKIIHTSHNAMKSAMSIISGNPDKRAMFDMAMEAVADDVSQKVGEMERFMDMSSSFMDSIDLQQGIFEEEGLKMLEKWEKESSILLGEEKEGLLLQANDEADVLDLNEPIKQPIRDTNHKNQYDSFFDLDD